MGYAIMHGSCFCCHKLFSFNPIKVPSVRDGADVRQPVCRTCIEAANKIRQERGMDELSIHVDAYEACDEAELPQ